MNEELIRELEEKIINAEDLETLRIQIHEAWDACDRATALRLFEDYRELFEARMVSVRKKAVKAA